MHDQVARCLCSLKQDFVKEYTGSAHIQEVIPLNPSNKFPIDATNLELLHRFARKNPIYIKAFEQKISSIPCIVYEGDINEYWLSSIKQGSSCQPFYPTWIMSAFIMALATKNFGYHNVVDIGSGDGRIAFCGKILQMMTHSIEIDDMLVDLQKKISKSTSIDFRPMCKDALQFDYTQLDLSHPAFFIGGLPQMGGDLLAADLIKKISVDSNLRKSCILVFAGSNPRRDTHIDTTADDKTGGWSSLINEYRLQIVNIIELPTIWTFDQDVETPYIYAKFT